MAWKIKGLKNRLKIDMDDNRTPVTGTCLSKWAFLMTLDHFDDEVDVPECKLCKEFGGILCEYSCEKGRCPVFLVTGKEGCHHTPYMRWDKASDDVTYFDGGEGFTQEDVMEAAEDEYLFLEGIYSIGLHQQLGYK